MQAKCKSKCKKPALKKTDVCETKSSEPKPLAYSDPIIDLPHFIRILGPKHFSIFRNFIPSLIIYTIAMTAATMYITDFKTVLQYLPYYNGKYELPEERKPRGSKDPQEESQSAES